MTTRILVSAALLLACGLTSAQTDQPALRNNAVVNKCTAADGSVIFSDAPCPTTHKSQKVDTSPALRTGSGGNNEQIAAGVADNDCRRQAHDSAYATIDRRVEESNRHIADYQRQQNELASQKVYAADGSGRLVDDPAARQTSADINAAITRERDFQQRIQTEAAATYASGSKACDDAKAKNAQPQPAGNP